jgi:hypothetical protein
MKRRRFSTDASSVAEKLVGYEIYESLDPETAPPDYEIIPPEPRVVRRTAHAVYDKCATYFLEIRDSLRNIKLDIEKFKEQQSLYATWPQSNNI